MPGLLFDLSPQTIEVLVGFGSYILLPFLAVLAHAKTRIFPFMALFCLMWLIVGVMAVGGGVTPMGPGDIVTREQRDAWFDQPWVMEVMRIWGTGLLIGIPLTAVTWVFEHDRFSRPAKFIVKIIEFALLPLGIWQFIKLLNN